MLRLLHAADIHSGLTTLGVDVGATNTRMIDVEASLDRLFEHAVERRAHCIVLSGDVFHGRSPGPTAIRALIVFFKRCEAAGIVVLYGSGNHDGPGTMRDIAGKTTGWLAETGLPMLHAYPAPTTEVIKFPDGEEVVVTSLPYPHKRSLEAQLPDATPAERTEMVSRQVEGLILNLAEGVRSKTPDLPSLFIGHLSVAGGMAGSESMMQIGWDVTVGAHVFDQFDYAALGHLHPQQAVHGGKAWYAGSPQYTSFGEIGQQKGFLYVEMDPDVQRVERLDSAARPMVSFDIDNDDQPVDSVVQSVPDGGIVRLRVSDALPPDYETRLLEAVSARASYVQMERVRAESAVVRARVEMAPEEGVIPNTGRWLDVNGLPREPYLTAAQEALAAVQQEG